MKRRLLLLIFLVIFIYLFFQKHIVNDSSNLVQKSDQIASPTPVINQAQNEISKENITYFINWFRVEDTKNFFLIPNFQEKLSSEEIIKNKSCKYLSSAGFYTTDNKPIGLFYTNNKKYSQDTENTIFNGFFYVSGDGSIFIDQKAPTESYRMAIQTGPLIKFKSNYLDLSNLNNDSARRNVLALSNDGKIIILSIYKTNSFFDGPRLQDLPEILTKYEKENHFILSDVINLDGGSASVFKNDYAYLTELTVVGSFLCYI